MVQKLTSFACDVRELSPMYELSLVVPCYNEEKRLAKGLFKTYLQEHPHHLILFVNDGSHDATETILRDLSHELANAKVLSLEGNSGKAEAVRRGVLFLQSHFPSRFFGFWDADLATPLTELASFTQRFVETPTLRMILGSRVKILGLDIKRSAMRHYLGRAFATAVSLTLRLPVYDTQCGAKMFRTSPETVNLFRIPFLSRWIFDVEIVARMQLAFPDEAGMRIPHGIMELPLCQWHDVRGSKLGFSDFLKAIVELIRIYFWKSQRSKQNYARACDH